MRNVPTTSQERPIQELVKLVTELVALPVNKILN